MERAVTEEQYKLCDVIEEQDFDSMTVVKDKNGISHVDTAKIFDPTISAHELQQIYWMERL